MTSLGCGEASSPLWHEQRYVYDLVVAYIRADAEDEWPTRRREAARDILTQIDLLAPGRYRGDRP